MPEFEMPRCWRHFWKGHRWWCRACDRETEWQFKQIAEAWWGSRSIRTLTGNDNPVPVKGDPKYRDWLHGETN